MQNSGQRTGARAAHLPFLVWRYLALDLFLLVFLAVWAAWPEPEPRERGPAVALPHAGHSWG